MAKGFLVAWLMSDVHGFFGIGSVIVEFLHDHFVAACIVPLHIAKVIASYRVGHDVVFVSFHGSNLTECRSLACRTTLQNRYQAFAL